MNAAMPRLKSRGLSLEGLYAARAAAIVERHAMPEPNSGCWLWMGSVGSNGYGKTAIGSRKDGTRRDVLAHQITWVLNRGPIPPGLELDHRRCRNKICVNPDHLVLCTDVENVKQPDGPAGLQMAKTHCPKGHPLTDGNLYIDPYGWRHCMTCPRERKKRMRRLGLWK